MEAVELQARLLPDEALALFEQSQRCGPSLAFPAGSTRDLPRFGTPAASPRTVHLFLALFKPSRETR
jgi:hypothetical protein